MKNLRKRMPKQRKDEILSKIQEIIEAYERKIKNRGEDRNHIPGNIEFQIKTARVAQKAISGTASHSEYKGENPEEIKQRYKEAPESFIIGKTIPMMWKSDIDVDRRAFMRPLTEEEIVVKVHPYVKDRDDD